MATITSGQIWKGFLKSGGVVNIAVEGTGTVKTVVLNGEQAVLSFGSIQEGRDFGAYHGDTDFEIYVDDGSCQFDSDDMVVESLRKINPETKNADIFELDEAGEVIGLIHPKTGASVPLGGSGGGDSGSFAAQAAQNDAASVGITSTASVNGQRGKFVFTGNTDGAGTNDGVANLSAYANGSLYSEYEVKVRTFNGTAFLDAFTSSYSGDASNSVNISASANNNSDSSSVERNINASNSNNSASVYERINATDGIHYFAEYYKDNITALFDLKAQGASSVASLSHSDDTDTATKTTTLTPTAIVEALIADNVTLQVTGNLAMNYPTQTGANAATFNPSNAPVANLAVSNWIKVTLNGVPGYIPFFS